MSRETMTRPRTRGKESKRRASGRAAIRLTPAAPPLVHEVVHHLAELADDTALAHDVAGWRVERHHAVADPPAPLPLRVQPDDALDPVADETQRPRLRVVVVVPGVAEQQ